MGVWIMAGVTFREAARKKMLWMALAAGGAFLTLFGTGLHFQAKDFAAHGMSPVLRREISSAMQPWALCCRPAGGAHDHSPRSTHSPVKSLPARSGGCDQARSTLASGRRQVVWLCWHADRVHCDHGRRRECLNVRHGRSNCASPHTRLLADVDGKPGAAFGNFCFCHLFFNVNQWRACARPSWARFPWRLD